MAENGSFTLQLGPKTLSGVVATLGAAIATLASGWNNARTAEAQCYMDWDTRRTEQRVRHREEMDAARETCNRLLQKDADRCVSACEGLIFAFCDKKVNLQTLERSQ